MTFAIRYILPICLIASNLLAFNLSAQNQPTTLQVVTKTIEKSLPFLDGYELNIEGEKADVTLQSWEKEYIDVTLELISKHPNRRTAKQDLDNMKYVAERIGRKIYIRNYVAMQKGSEKPSSNLKARYIITIPASCPVNLTNYFGNASIEDLTNEVSVTSEFCQIRLTNIKGEVNVHTRFGDVEGERLSGKVTIISQRSDVSLSDLKGVFEIKAKYGRISIDADESLVDLTISAEKTDIHFVQPTIGAYRYALTAQYGKITVPEFMDFDIIENSDVQRAIYNPEVKQATVNISTSFGNIVIGRLQK